jgi:hypothetical protein
LVSDEELVLRLIEQALQLPAGSLAIWDAKVSCPGCDFCRWPASPGER